MERICALHEARARERLRGKRRRVGRDTIPSRSANAAIPPSRFDAVTGIGLVHETRRVAHRRITGLERGGRVRALWQPWQD